jgi:hypothetical protein
VVALILLAAKPGHHGGITGGLSRLLATGREPASKYPSATACLDTLFDRLIGRTAPLRQSVDPSWILFPWPVLFSAVVAQVAIVAGMFAVVGSGVTASHSTVANETVRRPDIPAASIEG